MKNKFLMAILLASSMLFSGCVEKEPEIELVASISNPEQTVAPLTEVTLDGSQSTGPEGFFYEWDYLGTEDIGLSNTSEPTITFTPKTNGIYDFVLRLSYQNQTSIEATAQIQVTGSIVLDGNSFDSSGQMVLTDVESDPTMPDYIINEDLIIEKGNVLWALPNTDITIAIAENAGIIVNGRLLLTEDAQLTLVAQNSSWKGIYVDGGWIHNENSIINIKQAGNATFGDLPPAALTVANDGTLPPVNGSTFIRENASDYGIVISPTANFSQLSLKDFEISGVKYPLMTDMAHFGSALMNGLNISNYEYIHLTTSGASTTVGSIDGTFSFNGNRIFYIDGDFTAGSKISVNNSIIYMKEGAGIVGQDISINGSTFQGLDNATWKGLASTGLIDLTSSDIIGAGSAVHNTGAFTSLAAAAIYSTQNVIIDNSNFTNNTGFGVYINSFNTSSRITSTTFTNTTGTDVSLPFNIVGGFIKTGNSWSSTMPVELRSGQNTAGSSWKSLGTGNAYVIKDNILINTGVLTLEPGVLLKFETGKSLTVTTTLTAIGTDNERIIFNGINDTPGSWAGILLQGQYQMEYCTIINGGGSEFIGAQAAANVVFGSGSDLMAYPQSLYNFENNTVSLSADYGATILLGKYDPVTPTTTNIFENNVNGDIKLP